MKTLYGELKPHWRVIGHYWNDGREHAHAWICSECGALAPVNEEGVQILKSTCPMCGADFRANGGVRIS